MTLMDYLMTLRRQWVTIVVLTVLGALGGFLYAESSTAVYRSSTSVLVTSEFGATGSDLVQGSTYVENLVTSYVALAVSPKVLQPVIDDLGLETTPQSLANSVTADSPLNTVLINIHVTGENPSTTARIADAVTDSLSEAVAGVSPKVDGKPAIRLTTTQPASVPKVPVEPNKRRETALGLLIGLLLGVALSLVRRTWSAISDASDVARMTDIPVVGEIVESKRGTTLPAAVLDNTLGLQAESLRGLTANLSFLGADEGLRSLAITSPSAGEGKSSIATAAAIILAEADNRVLLVDADLRSPSLHTMTNLDNTIGLSTVLIGEDTLDVAAQPWGQEGLFVLTSGPRVPNPGPLLSSEAMEHLIASAEGQFDYVVVDTAPILSVVDAVWLGHMVAGVVVIARRGKTTPRSLAEALDILASSRTSVSGIVLSRVSRRSRTGYYSPAYVRA
jgi:succinoglycan biosynthesis transport protein ExoP